MMIETYSRVYTSGVVLQNFCGRPYQPLADSWEFYDNDNDVEPALIAMGKGRMELVADDSL